MSLPVSRTLATLPKRSGSRQGLAVSGVIFAALVAGMLLICPDVSRASGLLIADGGMGGVLEVREHDVKVTINNGIAVTTVTQVFHNTERRQVEALYTFPVPRGASVANFSMWIDGKEMVGEVLEKERARQIYDSYRQRRKDPGLLEQSDYRTFEMRIFPIGPEADQKVQVSYYQELDFDHDFATYVYPLATTTRQGAEARTTGRFSFNIEFKSAVPIVEVQSPSHPTDFAIAKHDPTYFQASYETREGNLNRDVVLGFHCARPVSGLDLIANKQKDEDGYFCLTLTAGEELAQAESTMDYVFVLDISGSMQNDGKLELSRRSLRAFIDSLAEEDRFEVLAFNVSPVSAFGALRKADDTAKNEAAKFLEVQSARGGTVLNPAMALAYKYAQNAGANRPLNVVILSDGLTEQKERQQLVESIRRRPAGSRVFCIGVGNDVNRALLEQLAGDSGGLAAFVSREDNFQRQAASFRRKLLHPVATDLKLDFSGVEVYDLEPAQLSALYHGMPLHIYGRYKGGGKTAVRLSGKVHDKPLATSFDFDLPQQQEMNPEIERMWAWRRVDRLLKEADAGGSRGGVLDEIVRLGEGYSIATEYTSFIVLENDAEYQRWKIDRRNALRIARDRGAQTQLATELEKLRSASTDALGPAPLLAASDQSPLDLQNSMKPGQTSTPRSDSSSNSPNNTGAQSRDFQFPGGGGAIDPLSGAIIFGLSALTLTQRRRKGAIS